MSSTVFSNDNLSEAIQSLGTRIHDIKERL
jgi:hypothetical protein